jgi:IclR family transcriptional regulator, KDG regulon repressor
MLRHVQRNCCFAERNMPERDVLKGIGQATTVLEAVAAQPGTLRLTDLSRRLSLAKPTMHRILRSWANLNYLEVDLEGRYRLGWKFFELTGKHHESLDLRELARPHLASIHARCGETVHLTVLEGSDVLYLDKIESGEPIRVYAAIGRRAPLHATASGKAMLAHQATSFFDSYLDGEPKRFTTRTLSTRGELVPELETIRQQGYAVNRGEWHLEVSAVAAPIHGFDGAVTAAFNATVPSTVLDEAKLTLLSDLLVDGADRLSRALGFVPGGRSGSSRVEPRTSSQQDHSASSKSRSGPDT